MTMQSQHLGLFYNAELIQSVQNHNDSEPIEAAIDFLKKPNPNHSLAEAQLAGLRYRFLDDDKSGLYAIDSLQHINLAEVKDAYYKTAQHTLAWLSVIESVRLHPAWASEHDRLLDDIRQHIEDIKNPPMDARMLDAFWSGAVAIGAAVVYEDDDLLQMGREMYEFAIQHHIHPEGYLKGVVDAEDTHDTYLQQVMGTAALVLMAEMAQLAGVDLWSIDNRGITPSTATTYIHYYYYYPDKWKWEAGLTAETTESIIKEHGAFIEMVNRHQPIRDIHILLDDQRPLYSLYCGGLATLTHGTPASRRKKWRLFG